MDYRNSVNTVLHWNYRRFTEFPLEQLQGEEDEITDIYLKENLISRIPSDIGKLNNLESLYLSGNDITELPKEISKLTRLKCLDVSGNRLRYIPDEIGEVRNLKFLILDENEIRELPLRIAELRMLRYLSVCDNKLQWLPQRPVYNYHHCEFKFWRNPNLKAIPFSLWYHMFREQQTRSFNIGCLTYSPLRQEPYYTGRCVLQLNQDIDCKVDVALPTKYNHIMDKNLVTAPSLFELCKRKMYEMISEAAKKLTKEPPSIYSDISFDALNNNNQNNNINYNLNSDLQKENKNVYTLFSNNREGYQVPANIIEKYFYYLPKVMKDDLCNGPVSRCENVFCKKTIFDFVYLEFCIEIAHLYKDKVQNPNMPGLWEVHRNRSRGFQPSRKIILIEDTEDIILSASFCSKSCADLWKPGKSLLNWKFV